MAFSVAHSVYRSGGRSAAQLSQNEVSAIKSTPQSFFVGPLFINILTDVYLMEINPLGFHNSCLVTASLALGSLHAPPLLLHSTRRRCPRARYARRRRCRADGAEHLWVQVCHPCHRKSRVLRTHRRAPSD